MSQNHAMARRIFPLGPFACMMDVYSISVAAFLVVAGVDMQIYHIFTSKYVLFTYAI